MIPLKDPASLFEDDYHSHTFFTTEGEPICTIEFDGIEEGRGGGIDCDCIVTWLLGDPKNKVPAVMERVNLMARERGSMASVIKSLIDDGAYIANWKEGFKAAVYASIIEWRGNASEGGWLEMQDATEADSPFLLRPWISATGTTILFAPPGSNKSMFALWMSLAVAMDKELWGEKPLKSGPVLFVDFEDEKSVHQFRFSAMLRSLDLDEEDVNGLIYHERVTRSLKMAKRRIRKLVRDLGCPLVVVDSISRARGSDVSSSEATVKLFEMFAQLGVPVLAIDHMTKEENKRIWTNNYDAREAQPLGSGVTQNSVRLGWMMNVLPGETDTYKRYNLYNTKHNNVEVQATRGLIFRADSDEWGTILHASFETTDMEFFVEQPKAESNKAVLMLNWHFNEQRKVGSPQAFTGTEIAAGSGVNRNTVVGHLRDSGYWSKIDGSKQYLISDDGMQAALMYEELG